MLIIDCYLADPLLLFFTVETFIYKNYFPPYQVMVEKMLTLERNLSRHDQGREKIF
jgi:hypothetical protein